MNTTNQIAERAAEKMQPYAPESSKACLVRIVQAAIEEAKKPLREERDELSRLLTRSAELASREYPSERQVVHSSLEHSAGQTVDEPKHPVAQKIDELTEQLRSNLAADKPAAIEHERSKYWMHRPIKLPEPAATEQRAETLLDWAWTIIANAGGGDWERESKEWQESAAKWREAYHGSLSQRHGDSASKAAGREKWRYCAIGLRGKDWQIFRGMTHFVGKASDEENAKFICAAHNATLPQQKEGTK